MALCDYQQQSFFWTVFDAQKDFNYNMPFQMSEQEQIMLDPVGFFYFHKPLVYQLLADMKRINNRRMDLRDLLKEMNHIWRYNNQQHQILNESDWTTRDQVAQRVTELLVLTKNKLGILESMNNLVTGDVTKYWETQEPLPYPLATTEKQSGTLRMDVPPVNPKQVTPMPFKAMPVKRRGLTR